MGASTGIAGLEPVSQVQVAKLTVTEKIGYGFGDLASNLFWQMFSIFIAKYYTDVFLLGAAAMGTMMLVTRLLDGITDPIAGAIADRTHTRWGHFRPYLVWMCVPMALTAVATFTVPSFEGTPRLIYAYVTLSLMMLAYTAINIPYCALLGVLTPSSEDRTSASGYRFLMALLPVFIIVNTAIPMAEYFGGGDPNSAKGWQMTMVIYSALAVVLYLATFAMTTERMQPDPGQKTSLKNDIKDLLNNRPWIVLCVVGIAALTYANIRGTVAIFYFENVVPGGKDYFGPVMVRAKAGLGRGRHRHRLVAGLLWLPAQPRAKPRNHQRHHADDEPDPHRGCGDRGGRAVVLQARRGYRQHHVGRTASPPRRSGQGSGPDRRAARGGAGANPPNPRHTGEAHVRQHRLGGHHHHGRRNCRTHHARRTHCAFRASNSGLGPCRRPAGAWRCRRAGAGARCAVA